ncbi:Leucine-rich repeat, cysteine-containing subtype [Artemisia annua]|uniref:Leucine-rich repeat, cysteine-containing subtype n=1 Tax=Artemisia annua TaxID=35608 RepID=A0A2U1LZV0_ARTAN|nr:Leucine-rich repeat, cysteine-containing subtype [Artemisia annua]
MEPLGYDELLLIYDKIHNVHDRKSFYQASKQILKVACIHLRELDIGFPDLLKDVLPSSPNMVKFKCNKRLSNTYMELLARSCPNLRDLRLGIEEDLDPHKAAYELGEFDFNDDGLCVVVNACSRLNEVDLSGRLHVGDVGVASLLQSCTGLTYLNLSGCASITDELFKLIGKSWSLRHLCLGGCMVSDLGLEYIAKGNLRTCLQKLHMDKCDNISKNGISSLKQMKELTDLKLSNCGVNITDSEILALSSIKTLEYINLSWLIDAANISSSHMDSSSMEPSVVNLAGCKTLTSVGLCSFAHHPRLKYLSLFSCHDVSWKDVEYVVSTCKSLVYIGLSRRIKTPMPKEGFNMSYYHHNWRTIFWK